MTVTRDEVCDLIQASNVQLMASFKELLTDIAGQIKRANETSTEQQMKEIKKLKFQETRKFKRKANEDQYKFNLKLAETFDSAKSAAEKSNLEKVKSDLEEDIYLPIRFLGLWSGRSSRRSHPRLAERLKTTILSSKANSTSLLYHRAYRKWKKFAISTFDGNVFPAKPFHVALYL